MHKYFTSKESLEFSEEIEFNLEDYELYDDLTNCIIFNNIENNFYCVDNSTDEQSIYKISLPLDDPRIQMLYVRSSASNIQNIPNPTEEVKKYIINEDGLNIRFLFNPSEELKLLAVTNSGLALQYISNPTDKIIKTSLNKNGDAIQYVDKSNQNSTYKNIAVLQNGKSIQFIDNPNKKLQYLAIKQNIDSINKNKMDLYLKIYYYLMKIYFKYF